MINIDQISKKLSSMSIEDTAQLNNFTRRIGGKITPMNFVISFFLSIQKDRHTLFNWSKELSIILNQTISYNGLKKSLNKLRAKFAQSFLNKVIAKQITSLGHTRWSTKLLEPFNHVYVEDSTCINLPGYLHKFFPGAYSKYAKAATAKIQFRQELKSGLYSHLELKHYRNNDQSFAAHILKNLVEGDLIIRDLGYAVLSVFQKIDELNAFFISRLRYGTNFYDYHTGEIFDLAKRLRKAVRDKEGIVELFLYVGKEAQLPARICAIKCPSNIIRKRRKAARKNRHAKSNHSKEYMELLGWTIFITNVSDQTLSASQILKVYGYRWRIEIIFKAWKSHLKLDRLFDTKTKLNKEQVEITFYLFLIWVTLFFARMYNFFLHQIYSRKKKILSLLKFAKFVKEHLTELLLNPDTDFWIEFLAYYCTYKKRNDRLNFCEKVYLII